MAYRISALALAVVNEIMAFGITAATHASTATAVTSSVSASTATSIVTPADQKLTALAKIMVDEVFGDRRQGVDADSVISDGRKLTKEINELAHYIAYSALHAAAVPENAPTPTDDVFFARITPMINNLSFRIVNEVSEIS